MSRYHISYVDVEGLQESAKYRSQEIERIKASPARDGYQGKDLLKTSEPYRLKTPERRATSAPRSTTQQSIRGNSFYFQTHSDAAPTNIPNRDSVMSLLEMRDSKFQQTINDGFASWTQQPKLQSLKVDENLIQASLSSSTANSIEMKENPSMLVSHCYRTRDSSGNSRRAESARPFRTKKTDSH